MNSIHIYAPPINKKFILRNYCPTCDCRTYKVGFFRGWIGVNLTCLKCGEEWADGERLERPFMPRWREKNIQHAKERYRKCVVVPMEREEEGR